MSLTVAPQALALLNNEFVIARAKEFAERLRKIDPARRFLGDERLGDRPGPRPDRRGARRALALLDRPDQSKALAHFCLMLFNLNEFIYVE
jgi:hypothetical protein